MEDTISKLILRVISIADEPLETKEIEGKISSVQEDVTRTKILYRLRNLRGEGHIKGKFVGSGKGAWIWWKKIDEK